MRGYQWSSWRKVKVSPEKEGGEVWIDYPKKGKRRKVTFKLSFFR